MSLKPSIIRSHVDQSAAKDSTWVAYEDIALELTDAQIGAALEKNPVLASKIVSAIENLDLSGVDFSVQALVLRAAEMHSVSYDVYALA